MTNRVNCHVTAYVTALMLLPTMSGAQTPATSFAALRTVLQPGDNAVVIDAAGNRSRGKVTAVTTSSLDLSSETRRFLVLRRHTPHSFAESQVTTVTRMDSRIDGAFIGFAAGFVPVILFPCGKDFGGGCSLVKSAYAPALGLFGAAVGQFVDGRFNKTVYRSGPRVGPLTITFFPLASRTSGATLSLRF